jgi:hypothetical protein
MAYWLFPVIWGFLVGLVGWGSWSRLVNPITDWLLPSKTKTASIKGVTRIIVILFLMLAIFCALALAPLLHVVAGKLVNDDKWRSIFGITFMSSLAGYFVYGFMNRGARKH